MKNSKITGLRQVPCMTLTIAEIQEEAMNRFQENPLYFLWKERSDHWFLFGINNQSNKVYFLEIVGNYSTKTSIRSIEEGRNLWRHLNADGFNKTELRDAGAIPFHLNQRIREWWRFVENGFKDNLYTDDPWDSSKVAWMPKTLKGIAEGKLSKTIDDYGSEQIANFWEYREPEEDGSDANNIHDEGENDNYWNKEGVFESESDKGDEITWTTADEEYPESLSSYCERDKAEAEYAMQFDQSYQEWIAMERQRDEEMKEAIEEFYKSLEE